MNLVIRKAVAALGVTGLLLGTGLGAASCLRHEERKALAQAKDGGSRIMELIAEDEIEMARQQFLETHDYLHQMVAELKPVDPDLAEVVGDITETIKMTFDTEPENHDKLTHLTARTLQWLDEAHFVLDG